MNQKGRKIKVAFFAPSFGICHRGAETVVEELSKRLSKSYTVVIFSRKKANIFCQKIWAIPSDNKLTNFCYQKLFPFKSFIEQYFANPLSEIEALTFSLAVFPKLLKGNFDLLFPTSIWGVILSRILRLIKKTPSIYINHGGAEKFILKQKPDVFVATTNDLFNWVKDKFPKVKSVYIPIGVNLKKFNPQVKPKRLPLQKPIILCVGALTKPKQIDLVIKAVSRFRKASLLILGSGPFKEQLQNLGEKLLGKNRFLITQVPYHDIPQYYAACNLFTLPSLDEPFGLVYLEAMAENIPVVAPDDKRRRKIIGKGGFFCNVEDSMQYANAIKQALSYDFKNLPLKQVQKFFWDKIAKEYKKLIEKVVKKYK